MSVLSPVNASNITNALLLKQVKTFFETKVNTQGQRILNSYAGKLNAVERNAEPWRAMKEDLVEPLRQVNRLVSRLENIKKTLDSLLKTLTTASKDPEADGNATGYAIAFDGQLKSVRGYAETTFDTPNLLGKQVPARLRFPIAPGDSATQTVNGTYMGSDYRIIDSNGQRWQPERVTKLLVQYDSFPDTPGSKKVPLANGAVLDTFDEQTDAVTFTINGATAAKETISGTVEREGLGVLDSWLYGGLATQANRDRATADIEAAKRIVDIEIRRYSVAATSVQFQSARADLNVDTFDKQRDALLQKRGQELANAKDELDRQFNVAETALVANIAFRRNYSHFFTAQKNNETAQRNATLFQKLIDIQT